VLLKSEIEKAVQVQQLYFSKKSSGLERAQFSNAKLSENYVLIITGIRRCGKSTLMHQLRQQLKKSLSVGYFNFEDPRVFGFEQSDFQKLNEVLGVSTKYYFFDEIQNVEGWEVFIRYLNDQKKPICVTGCNASLLSKELGTKLSGRHIQLELFPFSFLEYCQFKKKKPDNLAFVKYMQEGGFPDYLKIKQKDYLQQLLKDLVYRDIIVRHGIRNDKLVMDISLFLISNVGKEYSLNNIKKLFGVGSTNSVMNYVKWLEDAYLLFSVPRFSWSLKKRAVNPKKVYCIDPAFAQANSLSFSEDQGRLLKNIIFLELRRRQQEIFYFKEKGECDFITKEKNKVTSALQVCLEVTSDNKERELNGLLEAMELFNLKSGIIVTLNQADHLHKDGKEVELIPANDWIGRLES
jgi:predicted AAA+ superfamily ATPase